MTTGAERLELADWPGAAQFRFFKTFERPHFAITARIDVSRMMALKAQGLSPFRAALWAIGAGLHAVPALRTRFRGDEVTRYARLRLSPTIALTDGTFGYTYLDWQPDFARFDADAARRIAAVREGSALNPNDGAAVQDVAYLSCVPWLDYTALDNAMPDAADCIPRVGWGRIVPKGSGFDMAMTLQVHHALVDGRAVAETFAATQSAFDTLTRD